MSRISQHIIVLILFFQFGLQAQDALFSQFLNTKSLLNPALQSSSNGPVDLHFNFREQGGAISNGLPIQTILAEANFNFKGLGEDKFSFGINLLSDKGGQGHVGKNMSFLNFSYQKKLTGNYSRIGEHYLGFGTQIGGGQYTVGWDRFWFGNQFNREFGFIDGSIDSGEPAINASAVGRSGLIYDINAGASWYANFSEGLSAYCGVAAYHLTSPNISFFDDKVERLAYRYNIHGGANIKMSELLRLSPQLILIRQMQSTQFVLGSDIGIDNDDASEFAVKIGAYGRIVNGINNVSFEALILTFNIHYNRIRFGFGYDITTSPVAKYNGRRGSWEFNFGYQIEKESSGFRKNRKTFRF